MSVTFTLTVKARPLPIEWSPVGLEITLSRASIIKLFTAIINPEPQRAKAFGNVSHFQPSSFAVK